METNQIFSERLKFESVHLLRRRRCTHHHEHHHCKEGRERGRKGEEREKNLDIDGCRNTMSDDSKHKTKESQKQRKRKED